MNLIMLKSIMSTKGSLFGLQNFGQKVKLSNLQQKSKIIEHNLQYFWAESHMEKLSQKVDNHNSCQMNFTFAFIFFGSN